MRSSGILRFVLSVVVSVVLLSGILAIAGCGASEDEADTSSSEASADQDPSVSAEGEGDATEADPETFATPEEALASVMDPSWVYEVEEDEDTEDNKAYLSGPEKNRWLTRVRVMRDENGSWSVFTESDARGADWETQRWAAGWDDPDEYMDGPTSGPFEFVKDYLYCISEREFELASKRVTDGYATGDPAELSPGDDYLERFGYSVTWSRESGDVILVDTEENWTSGKQHHTYTVVPGGANYRIDAKVTR